MDEIFKVKMGVKAKDRITGFKGVVTARAEYLTGCRQYLVQPSAKGGEWKGGEWFDEDRLIDQKKKNDGGPQQNQAPIK